VNTRHALVIATAIILLAASLTLTPKEDKGENITWLYAAGRNMTAYLADEPQERYCGYYCYDYEAIIFIWPEGAPATVTFTMKNIEFNITLVHVSNCTVAQTILMEPEGTYTITGVSPNDFIVEVKGTLELREGEPIQTPLCDIVARQGSPS